MTKGQLDLRITAMIRDRFETDSLESKTTETSSSVRQLSDEVVEYIILNFVSNEPIR
jgi:hypothetical protein